MLCEGGKDVVEQEGGERRRRNKKETKKGNWTRRRIRE